VVQGASGAIRGEMATAVSVSTTGTPFFDWHTNPDNVCDSPSTARLFFQRKGDDMTAAKEFYRWWSDPVAFVLAQSSGVLLGASLVPSQWKSVLGKKGDASAEAAAGFQQAADDVQAIGLTFGGGCFYGHGVFVTGGTARFVLKTFTID
jgi:hypothetical protein